MEVLAGIYSVVAVATFVFMSIYITVTAPLTWSEFREELEFLWFAVLSAALLWPVVFLWVVLKGISDLHGKYLSARYKK